MLTAVKYSVSWTFRSEKQSVRRTLYHSTYEGCIEAARLFFGNPYTSDIEVHEVDSGRKLGWMPKGVGRVFCESSLVDDLYEKSA